MRIDPKTPVQEIQQAARSVGDQPAAQIWRAALQKIIIGGSPRLRRCLKLATEAAGAAGNVVILGETGTGKDLFARYIHAQASPVPSRLTVVDCRVADENSLATGLTAGPENQGNRSSPGFSGQGTLYLDEVHELSARCQAMVYSLLLTAGSWHRVIAASQQDLDRLTKQGRFRSDLLPLLQNVRIDLPALRERPEDILDLAHFFLQRLCLWNGLAIKTATPEFNAMLLRYPWPGNVRELINTLEQGLLSAEHCKTLFPKHLPSHIRIQVARNSLQQTSSS